MRPHRLYLKVVRGEVPAERYIEVVKRAVRMAENDVHEGGIVTTTTRRRRVLPKGERRRAIVLDALYTRDPVYHLAGDSTFVRDLHRMQWYTKCGRAVGFWSAWLSVHHARKVARPCARCFPAGTGEGEPERWLVGAGSPEPPNERKSNRCPRP